jgi:cytochrome c-type biogenesis protein CcmH/NrfF
MTALIIIILYVLNIFIARWMNKILFKKGILKYKEWIEWFIPIIPIIIYVAIYFIENKFNSNCFTGKNW